MCMYTYYGTLLYAYISHIINELALNGTLEIINYTHSRLYFEIYIYIHYIIRIYQVFRFLKLLILLRANRNQIFNLVKYSVELASCTLYAYSVFAVCIMYNFKRAKPADDFSKTAPCVYRNIRAVLAAIVFLQSAAVWQCNEIFNLYRYGTV